MFWSAPAFAVGATFAGFTVTTRVSVPMAPPLSVTIKLIVCVPKLNDDVVTVALVPRLVFPSVQK